MLGVWSAVAFFVLWLIGFLVFAQWIPPIAPSATAEEIGHIFSGRTVPILVGMALMGAGSVLYLPWTVLIADLIKEVEGPSFILSGTQLGAGVIATLTFMLPSYAWAAAAFRADRNPEITQALSDFGWLLFITPIAPFILQYVIIAMAVFMDKRPTPMLPRWLAYVQIWVAILFLPAVLAYFMKSGPFAWNGVFVWWIPFAVFTFWFVAMIVYVRKAVLSRDLVAASPVPS